MTTIKRHESNCTTLALMLKERQVQYPELINLTDKEIGAMAKDMYLSSMKIISEIKL